MRKSSYCFSAS